MTKDEIISYLKSQKEYFMQKYKISKLALFGSFSRDENTQNSDIDIAIQTPIKDYFLLYDLKEELENKFHTKVDLIRLRDKMNQALKRRIEKDGIYI
jgi:predicted nucleotidyltransferase